MCVHIYTSAIAEESRKCGVLCSRYNKHCIRLKRGFSFSFLCQLIIFYNLKISFGRHFETEYAHGCNSLDFSSSVELTHVGNL